MNQKDLTGQNFGMLTTIKIHSKSRNGNLWECLCSCGNKSIVLTSNLLKGHTKSCGCIGVIKLIKMNTTHNLSNTKLYGVWGDIKSRCTNPKKDMYYIYGQRGIKMCEEWEKDFTNFYKWSMSNGYKDGLTIDRIDNDGNYEPKNCRWVSYVQQNRNRRITIFIEHKGQRKTLMEWSELFDVKYHTAYDRYKKGLVFEKIFKN